MMHGQQNVKFYSFCVPQDVTVGSGRSGVLAIYFWKLLPWGYF